MGILSGLLRLFDTRPETGEAGLYQKTCPEMVIYKVRGRSSETNRIRTEVIVRVLPFDAEAIYSDPAFTEIVSIQKVNPEPPTLSQIKYAEDLALHLPDGCGKRDASCLITRKLQDEDEDDKIFVHPSLAEFAATNGVFLSTYCGERRALDEVWRKLSDEKKLEFLVFCIHQSIKGKVFYNMDKDMNLPLYIKFAEVNSKNMKLLRSVANYRGSDLSLKRKPNKNRNAYTIAKNYLFENNAI